MRLSTGALALSLALSIPGGVAAQPLIPGGGPPTTGTIVQVQPNTTGNDLDVVISRGSTGAATISTDSAAGGNASRPEQRVPNGSANGGGGNGSGG